MEKMLIKNEEQYKRAFDQLRHDNPGSSMSLEPPERYPAMLVHYVQDHDMGDWLHYAYVYPEELTSA